jgi:predicted metal-dependent peptidase
MLAHDKLTKARAGLILDQPFFGSLALRLPLVPDPAAETLWTDGRKLGYNPGFVDGLELPELKTIIAHEILHCALAHTTRRGERKPDQWNIAGDFAINGILQESGFLMPADALLDPQYNGLSAEEIYNRLTDDDDNGQGAGQQAGGNQQQTQAGQDEDGDGDGPADPGRMGEVRDAGQGDGEDQADTPGQLEEEWKVSVAQAATQAKGKGALGAGLARLAEKILEHKIDWRDLLREFVERSARNDYNFNRPNTRYLHTGFVMPSLISDELPEIAVVCDTSGSVDARQLASFGAELQAIAAEFHTTINLSYCDTKVYNPTRFEPGDEIKLDPAGGGGTDFRPAFAWIEEAQLSPACLIFFTDLFGTFPEQAPEYPVLWLDFAGYGVTAPFGETILLTS